MKTLHSRWGCPRHRRGGANNIVSSRAERKQAARLALVEEAAQDGGEDAAVAVVGDVDAGVEPGDRLESLFLSLWRGDRQAHFRARLDIVAQTRDVETLLPGLAERGGVLSFLELEG